MPKCRHEVPKCRHLCLDLGSACPVNQTVRRLVMRRLLSNSSRIGASAPARASLLLLAILAIVLSGQAQEAPDPEAQGELKETPQPETWSEPDSGQEVRTSKETLTRQLDAQAVEAQNDITEIQKQIAEIQVKIQETEEELGDLLLSDKSDDSKIRDAVSRMEDLRKQEKHLSNVLDELQVRNAAIQGEIEAAQREIEDLEVQFSLPSTRSIKTEVLSDWGFFKRPDLYGGSHGHIFGDLAIVGCKGDQWWKVIQQEAEEERVGWIHGSAKFAATGEARVLLDALRRQCIKKAEDFRLEEAKQAELERIKAARETQLEREAATRRAELKRQAESRRADSEREAAARKAEQQRKAVAEQRLHLLTSKYGHEVGRKIFDKQIWIGMTRDMVRDSWGPPMENNRTVTADSVSEQWVYSRGRYLYFVSGVLTAWQD